MFSRIDRVENLILLHNISFRSTSSKIPLYSRSGHKAQLANFKLDPICGYCSIFIWDYTYVKRHVDWFGQLVLINKHITKNLATKAASTRALYTTLWHVPEFSTLLSSPLQEPSLNFPFVQPGTGMKISIHIVEGNHRALVRLGDTVLYADDIHSRHSQTVKQLLTTSQRIKQFLTTSRKCSCVFGKEISSSVKGYEYCNHFVRNHLLRICGKSFIEHLRELLAIISFLDSLRDVNRFLHASA